MKLEELKIYKEYVDLTYYTLDILKKYPKQERFALVSDIKNITYDGLKEVIRTYKKYDKKEKFKSLNDLDEKLKLLKALIKISYRNKYINSKNYKAWNKKIDDIVVLMAGWVKWVKQ